MIEEAIKASLGNSEKDNTPSSSNRQRSSTTTNNQYKSVTLRQVPDYQNEEVRKEQRIQRLKDQKKI